MKKQCQKKNAHHLVLSSCVIMDTVSVLRSLDEASSNISVRDKSMKVDTVACPPTFDNFM
jgi:predicted transcriptional regulator